MLKDKKEVKESNLKENIKKGEREKIMKRDNRKKNRKNGIRMSI